MQKYGQMTWDDVTGGSDLFERILAVERNSWKWRRGLSIIAQGYGGMYRAFLESAATKGWLHVTLLSCENRPIAYVYSAAFEGIAEALKTAYDATFHKFSPGRMTLWHHLHHLAQAGVRRVNLHIGSKEYKSEWYTHTKTYSELFVRGRSQRARTIWFFLFSLRLYGRFRVLPDVAKRVIRRLGFEPSWSELSRMGGK